MSTRLYPTVQAPTAIIHGPAAGTWAGGGFDRPWVPVQWTWRLRTSKTDAGAQTSRSFISNQQGNHDFFGWRSITMPLEAQTIAGTLDVCFHVASAWVAAVGGVTSDSIVRYKIHAYITVGQTAAVRHVLLDNYLDSTDWPLSGRWRSLASAQALTSGAALAGDCVMVEIGARIVSSPTPTPTYPPTEWTLLPMRGTGCNNASNVPYTDATAGSSNTLLAPWLEFSANLVEQAAPAAPDNDACAEALTIASLPHTSAWIDTSQSADTQRRVWWTWTAPTSGSVLFHTKGANYGTWLEAFTGGCGALSTVPNTHGEIRLATHRSQSSIVFTAVQGTQYWISVRNETSTNNAINSGGLLRLSAVYRGAPVEDDLYLPCGDVIALRDGAIVNLTPDWADYAPTGVAIDYTRRSITNIEDDSAHAAHRLLLGLHSFELVELLDLATLSYGSSESEVDYIGNPIVVSLIDVHPAQLHCTAAGLLYIGFFGNGYRYVQGNGSLPSLLNSPSSVASYSAIRVIEATHGDSQPGAPYTAASILPAIDVTAPWAIAVDEVNGILFYTSGGFYVPVGGTVIKRWNLTTGTQMADFATLALSGTNNPGLKGLQVIPAGGLLVCSGTVVHRLSAAGAVVTTYTPSIAEDAQSLTDVKLTADGLSFWTIDEATTRLFKFNLATGVEETTVQPYGMPGTLTQMAIFQPDGVSASPDADACELEPPSAGCWSPAMPSAACAVAHAGPLTAGCWTPSAPSAACVNPATAPAAACWAPFSVAVLIVGLKDHS